MDNIQQFWNDFCVVTQQEDIKYKDAFQFGASADWLANLVVEGKKTATTSGYVFYELEKEFPSIHQNGRDSFCMFSAYTYSDKLEFIDMRKIELYTPFFF